MTTDNLYGSNAAKVQKFGIDKSCAQEATIVALAEYATAVEMSYDAKLASAQNGFRSAGTRLPWLRQRNDSGSGLDRNVFAHFLSIDRRMQAEGRR